jgi:hypothetical protein
LAKNGRVTYSLGLRITQCNVNTLSMFNVVHLLPEDVIFGQCGAIIVNVRLSLFTAAADLPFVRRVNEYVHTAFVCPETI